MQMVIMGGATEVLTDDRRAELELLVDALREDDNDVRIYEGAAGGLGVTWWELALIYLRDHVEGVGTDALILAAMTTVTRWAREHFRRHPDSQRPQYVAIYGPDGRLLKSVKINPDGSEENMTEGDVMKHRSPPPDIDNDEP